MTFVLILNEQQRDAIADALIKTAERDGNVKRQLQAKALAFAVAAARPQPTINDLARAAELAGQ